MTEQKRWIVTVADDHQITDVQREAADSGFEVDQVLDQIGVFTGRSDDVGVRRIRSLPGVADVSSEEPVDIGPPGGETW